MKISYKDIRKYCTLINQEVEVIQKLIHNQLSNGNEEIIPGPKIQCPYAIKCFYENKDCIHTEGNINSKNDPLVYDTSLNKPRGIKAKYFSFLHSIKKNIQTKPK
ncbi:MAG: hypothetical protein A2539_08900 [Elusimicrobia bacterium RIFOXYD2_FULL_34_15]|nr:MAG: hypothetical protein A2539_08900 [Elusimicrobia bacterium RIFOXYD2_FULL_34_15]